MTNSQNNELVSIVVPIYNVEKYLKRCIDSIINQTYKNIEIILVDDGSSDESSTICDNYKKIDHRIKVIHKKNAGLGMARNTGIEESTGRYIMFIDGDDYISSNHLSELIQNIEKTNSDAVLCGYTRVLKDGQLIPHIHIYNGQEFNNNQIIKSIIPKICGKKNDNTDNIEMSVCMGIFSNTLIKKHKIKFVSEREYISEDFIFDLDFYPKTQKISFISSTSYFYCDNEGSLTTKYRKDRFKKQVFMTKYIEKKLIEIGIYDSCIQRLYNTLISIARYSIKLEQKFYKENGFKISIKNINSICNNQYLISAFNIYDENGVPLKNKIINHLIKKKKVYLLWIIMYFKNLLNI